VKNCRRRAWSGLKRSLVASVQGRNPSFDGNASGIGESASQTFSFKFELVTQTLHDSHVSAAR